ncbi:MAG TPA: cation diffusion facilitator family transporter [Hyphomicrobiaceae bacterium]|nr:cation diffusion facilitator family transporter [Hyphomicrobiaceae bacterium]
MPSSRSALDRTGRVAIGSIAVAAAVLGLKYAAYLTTGSVALYSDALESIVNVLTGMVALAAILVSARPPDKNHPFGHTKAEYVSAVIEGALIIVASLLIFREAYEALIEPRPLKDVAQGLGLNGLATALNGLWSWFLISRGRAWRSPALAADGWHLLTDVATSIGVFVGFALAAVTGWTILDPVIAIAVAINILWAGYRITLSSMSGLMDESVDAEIQERIRHAIKASGEGALEAHDIRTRRAARATFIEFHLVVPGAMTVEAAHAICDRLEAALEAEIEGSEVVIHVEPEHKAKRKGALRL